MMSAPQDRKMKIYHYMVTRIIEEKNPIMLT